MPDLSDWFRGFITGTSPWEHEEIRKSILKRYGQPISRKPGVVHFVDAPDDHVEGEPEGEFFDSGEGAVWVSYKKPKEQIVRKIEPSKEENIDKGGESE